MRGRGGVGSGTEKPEQVVHDDELRVMLVDEPLDVLGMIYEVQRSVAK